ncbi:Uncharacterized protein FKW44_001603 [Caligus rogercresseyi]|uniref:Uncharacterized protein n=1 Tax=Caligus rogercresseyi TaxID=217165 RepID=A0A7T8QVQ6_CALRO|nr:Uncharacterized protein FKW44_001603 [Caligus rogercresseyi]
MVLGVVASDRKKMFPLFFKAGEKMCKEIHNKVLRYTVLPWLKANYPRKTMCGLGLSTNIRSSNSSSNSIPKSEFEREN